MPAEASKVPPSSDVTAFVLCLIFQIIACASVAIRIYCRRVKNVPLGVDDLMVVLSLVFLAGLFICVLLMINGGVSRRNAEMSPAHLEVFRKALFAGEFIYAFSVTSARASINMLFIRAFNVQTYRRIAYANIALNISWGLYALIVPLIFCVPIARSWNPRIKGHCKSRVGIELGIPIWGVVCDLTTWSLPLPIMWRLHMSLAERIGLMCIFGIGLVAVGFGGARIASVIYVKTTDFPSEAINRSMIITFVEAALATFCACGPVFRPFVQKFLRLPWICGCFGAFSCKSSSADSDMSMGNSTKLGNDRNCVSSVQPYVPATTDQAVPRQDV